MGKLKRITLTMLILLLALLVVVFIIENRQPVSLNFLGWASAQMPVAGWIAAALLLGLLVGPLLAWLIGPRRGRRL